jgi:nicotinate-nucleotide adenylyltransferase
MGKSVNSMSVGLFGGTFNPVHFGHLKIAQQMAEQLQVRHMRMLPCAIPPHREEPKVNAEQRLAMLRIALEGYPLLEADDLELHRVGPSYTIETLQLVRQEIGQQPALFLCIGIDALANIHHWHRWQELLDYCHIAVSPRPHCQLADTGTVTDWLDQHRCDDLATLQSSACGYIYFCNLAMLEISSTTVRDNLKRGENITSMVPACVVNYIKQHNLYE